MDKYARDEAAQIRREVASLRYMPYEPTSGQILDLIGRLATLIERSTHHEIRDLGEFVAERKGEE